ncbi:MAG: UDP-N-acetylmuramate dehydrogenase [Balneolaceae bacterium]
MSEPSEESIPSLPVMQKNKDLSRMNTLGIRAVASSYVDLQNSSQLVHLKNEGFFENHSPLILGGGSNILLKNNPQNPVLKISIPGIEIKKEFNGDVLVKTAAGVTWHDLVTWTVENNLGGIENLALIPGTVGAAPIQNIGAYGVELNQVFETLTAFDIATGTFKTFAQSECAFAYRDSIFKRELKNKVIVTDVTLRLSRPPHPITDSYYALQDYFREQSITSPSIKDVYDAVIYIRKSKLPDPAFLGNAGSFFKNPFINQSVLTELQEEYPEVPFYPADDNLVKIPAGWLIEKAGWKGKRIGNVGTFENQALVIVNFGGATGQEIFDHAQKIQGSVQNKFGIELTPEVNVVE